MFYGLILLCAADATEFNNSTCRLMSSPAVYDTQEECVEAVQGFLKSPMLEVLRVGGYEILSIECNNVLPEEYQGQGV